MVLRRQGKASEAIAEYRRAIALQPDYADYHYNLGNVLTDRGEAGEAMALYRKAIELAPEHAEAHLNLGHALRAEGRFAEAVASLKRAHELGSRDPRWGYPTSRLIAEAERLATLDRKLPRVLAGEEQAADARERLAYADLCYRKRQFERAARFFEEAFAQDPALAADLSGSYRYNAACAAALSGAGEGRDAGAIAEEARARRRAQARDWLRADLEAHRRTFREDASTRTAVVRALEHWLHDPDLKGLREDELAAELPAEERAACGRLWSEVRELIESAGKEKP
jgi:tetratricopeptide (TPR) repeat protein